LERDKALGKEMELSRRRDEAQALAREKTLLAAHSKAAAKEKADTKRAEARQKASSKKSGSKTKAPEVFTVTVGGGKQPAKHSSKPN
jgi:hypothetical protein